MLVEITEKGVYDAKDKHIDVGETIEVDGDKMPAWLINKAREVGGQKKAKTAVTNPKSGGAVGYVVVDKGSGWYVVTLDGQEVTKSMRKDDVSGFDEMTDEDKAAFVDLHQIEA